MINEPQKKKKNHIPDFWSVPLKFQRLDEVEPTQVQSTNNDWLNPFTLKFKATQNIYASTAHSIGHIQKFITKNNKNKKK